ncbi:MAG: hypothetical protein J3K34DRAFT_458098 [Monoraphidium minutum]|nr:MAG: hypothetical protein J3K34DRAFT_458098 [Monoraphidium minutum]
MGGRQSRDAAAQASPGAGAEPLAPWLLQPRAAGATAVVAARRPAGSAGKRGRGGRSGSGTGEESATEGLATSDEALPLEVARFLATGSGVKWLVDIVKDWPDMLFDAKDMIGGSLETTGRSLRRAPHHLNTFVVGEYKKLVRSEMGRRLINRSHEAEAAIADPLSVPLYVVEDIVRLRLHQLVTRNWKAITWRLCTRASLACCLINFAKAGAKRLARGRPRAERAVAYACDVLFPTEFYGPVVGITLVVFRGVNELLEK